MPIYEYKCIECGSITENLESISANNKSINCSNCGNKAKKIISLSTFKLKGTGWYVTDYKDKNKQSHTAKSNSTNNKDVKIEHKPDKKESKKEDAKASTKVKDSKVASN